MTQCFLTEKKTQKTLTLYVSHLTAFSQHILSKQIFLGLHSGSFSFFFSPFINHQWIYWWGKEKTDSPREQKFKAGTVSSFASCGKRLQEHVWNTCPANVLHFFAGLCLVDDFLLKISPYVGLTSVSQILEHKCLFWYHYSGIAVLVNFPV